MRPIYQHCTSVDLRQLYSFANCKGHEVPVWRKAEDIKPGERKGGISKKVLDICISVVVRIR